MIKVKSISLIMLLFVAVLFLLSCGTRTASEEAKHRDPRQEGEISDKQTFTPPHELYDPPQEEYKSPFLKNRETPSHLNWVGLNQALQQIKNEKNKKKAVIYFATQKPCRECEIIEKTVFSDPKVLKYSTRWVFVRINIDVQTDMAEFYKIESVPAFKFLEHKGHAYKTHIGSVTQEQFANMLLTWF